jgi:hypothetical protein
VTLDTNHVMAGRRAGHLSPRVPIEMTGSVAGCDAYVNVLGDWYKAGLKESSSP